MKDAASGLAMKALALAVLLVAAWVLFKVVLGFITGIVWIVVILIAVVAGGWALMTILR